MGPEISLYLKSTVVSIYLIMFILKVQCLMGNGYSVGSKEEEEENVEICSHEVRNLYLYVMFS